MENILLTIQEITNTDPLQKSKQEEVVDARFLFVFLLSEQGLYPSQIARLAGLSTRRVTGMLSDFPQRLKQKKVLRLNLERIRKQLGRYAEGTRK